MPPEDDPVKEAFGETEDLYDVATWEVRSGLDRVAVTTWRALQRSGRVLLVSVAVALFATELTLTAILVAQQPIIGGLALFSLIPAVAVAGYFWLGDPTMREPLSTLAFTFVLGIALASIAAVVNTATFGVALAVVEPDLATSVVPIVLFFLVVGPVEETVKWLAVRVYAYRTDEFDAVVDGVVYGAVAGLGFATIENVIYISQGYLAPPAAGLPGGVASAVEVATSRAFVGPGHVIYSAWAGFYLGLAKFNPGRRGPIVVKGLLIAALLHATYNTAVSLLPGGGEVFLVFVVVYDGFWIVALWTKLTRYRDFYRRLRPVREATLTEWW